MRTVHSVRFGSLLIALLGASVALADVRDSSPAGFTLENTTSVPVDPMSAWKALVEDIDDWWPRDHTWWGTASTLSIEARAGGCFCEIAGDRQAAHMQVAFADPGKLLRLIGGLGPLQGMGLHGVMEWRFEPLDAGTRITLYYRAGGYATDDLTQFAPVVDAVQAQQLGGLAEHVRR
jgi:uncharacterized protein YndB with AHSA1/START domain